MSETYSTYQERVYRELEMSMELLEATYPLSQDPKVLVSALAHLKVAQEILMEFLAKLSRKKQSLELLKNDSRIEASEIEAIENVQQLYKEQQKSGVEFRRKEAYIVCDDEYNIVAIHYDLLHNYLKTTIGITEKLLR